MAIIKHTSWAPYNMQGAPVAEVVKSPRMGVYHSEYHPEIAAFLKDLYATPGGLEKGHLYVLCNAMGGSECWGHNRNNDLFPARPHWGLATKADTWGYDTFRRYAHVFRHHRNQLALGHPSYGRIVKAVWNKPMWRVETIAKVNRHNRDVEDVVQDLDDGRPCAVSMGCRIPYDECTVCGHKAVTNKEHCVHLKTQMGHMLENGTVVGMINWYPLFFDQSFVTVGADPSAWAHTKLADGPPATEAAPLHKPPTINLNRRVYAKVASKEAEHIKEVPAMGSPGPEVMAYLHACLGRREQALPRPLQKKMASHFKLGDIWSTMHFAGIEMHPQEFQYMALCREHPLLAEKLADAGVTFRLPDGLEPTGVLEARDLDVGPAGVQPGLLGAWNQWDIMEKRSGWRPFLMCRAGAYLKAADRPVTVPYESEAGPQDDEASVLPLLATLAGLYWAARRKLRATPPDAMRRKVQDPNVTEAVLESVNKLKGGYRNAHELADDLRLPAGAYVVGKGVADTAQAVGAPAAQGEIYWDRPVLPGKTASVKGKLLLGAVGVPAGYGTAGYYEAEKNTYGKLPFHKKVVHENPFVSGLVGAGVTGATYAKYKNWRDKGKAPPEPKTKGLLDKAKGVFKGVAKRADLVERIGHDPALWEMHPDVQDRLLAEAVLEHVYPDKTEEIAA